MPMSDERLAHDVQLRTGVFSQQSQTNKDNVISSELYTE